MGVQDRCHLIELHAAPAFKWLPLVKRILSDSAAQLPDDDRLLNLISTCNGSARKIVTAAQRLAGSIEANSVSPVTSISLPSPHLDRTCGGTDHLL